MDTKITKYFTQYLMQSNKSLQSSLNLKNKLKQPKFVHICVEKRKSMKTNRKLEKKKKTKNFDYQSINIKLA
jgi:hypothetical protein